MKDDPVNLLAKEMAVLVPGNKRAQQLIGLEAEINRLLTKDFDRLVAILYRVDVSEEKLKRLLKEKPGEDAAKIILALLLERQEQKIRSRQQFNQPPEDLDEQERW